MTEPSLVTMAAQLISFQEEFDKFFHNSEVMLQNQFAYNVLSNIYGDLIRHRFDLERLMHEKTVS